jgi:hypothetical protein
MRVGGDEVNEPFGQHPFAKFLTGRTECSQQTAGGDLHQTAAFHERSDQLPLFQQTLVAFGMGKHPGHASGVESLEDWFERKIKLVGQL